MKTSFRMLTMVGAFTVTSAVAAAPTIDWIRQFSFVPGVDEDVRGIAADASGVYLTGGVRTDAFVQKRDPSGNELWSHVFGTPGSDSSYALAADASGVYVGGWVGGALPGQTFAGGEIDCFVRKYDLDGAEIWTRQFGTSAGEDVLAIALTPDAVYVGGVTAGQLPGQTSAGGNDPFVRKYDKDGNEIWTRQFGISSANEGVSAMGVDASGLYVLGGIGTIVREVVLWKLDYDGAVIWIRQFGAPGSDTVGNGIAVDASGIYVHGSTRGALPGQASMGGEDDFVRKYDGDGNVIWTRQYGTSANEGAGRAALDPTGVYVTGYTPSALPGQASAGGLDVFVQKYDHDGSLLWTFQFGTAGNDDQSYLAAVPGSLYVGGSTTGTFPGQTAGGAYDCFVAKLHINQAPVANCSSITLPAGENCLADGSIDAGSFDPDGDSITLAQFPSGPYPLGDTAVTLLVTDSEGASATCAGIVTVVDTIPPAIVAPAPVTAQTAPGACGASVALGTPAVMDNCGILGVNNNAPPVFPDGVTEVIWVAVDDSGNTATATQFVTVEDLEAPTLVCPQDINLPCSLDLLVPVVFSATASDNCDPAPRVVCSPSSGSGFPVGSTVVGCTATDFNGNQASGSFTVTRAALGFEGFLSPLGGADGAGGSFSNPLRTFNAGSTLPVKFKAACGGTSVTDGVHRLQVVKWIDANTPGTPIDARSRDKSSQGNQFRYNETCWQFEIDLKSTGMGKGIWQVIATLSDGSSHFAWISVK